MSLIGNELVAAAAVQNRQPFETKARNLRGFTDVAGIPVFQTAYGDF